MRHEKTTLNALVIQDPIIPGTDGKRMHEVWVWSYPYGGMWESNYVGDSGFWLNSDLAKWTT